MYLANALILPWKGVYLQVLLHLTTFNAIFFGFKKTNPLLITFANRVHEGALLLRPTKDVLRKGKESVIVFRLPVGDTQQLVKAVIVGW